MTDEEIQQFIEEGRELLGNLNWILIAIGGVVSAVGIYLSPKKGSIARFI